MKRKYIWIIIAVISVIIVFLIYVFTFGKVDITKENDKRQCVEGEKNDLNKLENRHRKLKVLIGRKEYLNRKLDKRFKRIYFGVRLLLSSLYLGFNVVLYNVFNITKLSDLLNWNQLMILVISLFSFIAFGTLANAKEYIVKIKLWVELRIYSKYVDISEQLNEHKKDEIILTSAISEKRILILDLESEEEIEEV